MGNDFQVSQLAFSTKAFTQIAQRPLFSFVGSVNESRENLTPVTKWNCGGGKGGGGRGQGKGGGAIGNEK